MSRQKNECIVKTTDFREDSSTNLLAGRWAYNIGFLLSWLKNISCSTDRYSGLVRLNQINRALEYYFSFTFTQRQFMKKPVILFIQGGGKGAYKEDKKLALFLQDALKKTYDISYPKIPDENNPNYETYRAKIDEELKKIHTRVILVGHSVGGCFLVKYLSEQKIDKDIAGMFFIATPFWGDGGWQYEGFVLESDFPSKLPTEAPIFFYHSTNDEIVPFSHLALYSKKLPHAIIRKIVGRGHQLNNDLSELVQDIKGLSI